MISGKHHPNINIRRLVIYAALLLCSGMVSAFASNAPTWGIERLMQNLSTVELSRAKFVEIKHDPLLKQPLVLKGVLQYEAPDYIRKETFKPFYNQFIVRGNKLVITNAKQKTRKIKIQKYASLWAFVEAFRATLQGNLKMLRRFYDVDLVGSEKNWTLKLKPLNRRMKKKVKHILVQGRFAKISSISITGLRGDRSKMTILQ